MRGGERSSEPFYARSLAERLAGVRLVLTIINFGVLFLDAKFEASSANINLPIGVGVACAFFVYALVSYGMLRYGYAKLATYELVSPLLDIGFAVALISFTGSYTSPFNLWVVFGVIGTGFSRYAWLPWLATGMGFLGHVVIASVPQPVPLDVTVVLVRATFLLGVGAVVAVTTSYLTQQSKLLAAIESAAGEFSQAHTEDDVVTILLRNLQSNLGLDEVWVSLEGRAGSEAIKHVHGLTRKLLASNQDLGTVVIGTNKPISKQQGSLIAVLCDRAAAALYRIRANERLAESRALGERRRIADELHDNFLQTLAALDMRAEAARILAGPQMEAVQSELDAIKQIARDAAQQVRDIAIAPLGAESLTTAGLEALLQSRWPGDVEMDVDASIALSDVESRALRLLITEGLNNAKRHARATKVTFRMTRRGASVVCSLEDNGIGVQPKFETGYGLTRLRELVEEAGGSLDIGVLPDGGARITAEFRRA